MNFLKQVVRRNVLSFATRLSGSQLYSVYLDLVRHEWDSRGEIEKLRNRRLIHLLQYAYTHVPYYRDILEKSEVIDHRGRIDIRNFHRVPFLTKEIIRAQGERLLSCEWKQRKTIQNSSGGSTGAPVNFYQDQAMWDANMGNKLFYLHMNGKEPGEPEVKLWGSERDIFTGSIGLKAKLSNWVYNRRLLNSFKMSEDQMRRYAVELTSFRPKLLWAYVDSAFELARFIQRKGLNVYNPPVIMLTAGTLHDDVRQQIQDAFPRSSIINQYGSREVGDIACECPSHQGLHVFEYFQYLEVVDERGEEVADGVMGENVVTLLTNYSMPLIRYRIGDTSVKKPGSCTCGRKLRLLERVTGRVTDHFKTPDGTLIHGEYFTHLFYHQDWVKKFQVVQEDYRRVVVRVVAQGRVNEVAVRDVTKKIRLVMGEDCVVEWQYLDEISPSQSGKYLYTLSNIS